MTFPDHLQTALLFDTPEAIFGAQAAIETVVRDFNNALPLEMPRFELRPITTQDCWAFGNEHHNIAVTLRPEPLGMEGFGPVLSSAFYANMQQDNIALLRGHRAHILLEIGLGSVTLPTETPEIVGFPAETGMPQEDFAKFRDRVDLSIALAMAMMQQATPTLVHWGQSHQIYQPEVFTKFAIDEELKLPLMVHPLLQGNPNQDPNGPVAVGINAFGAQHVIGKTVIFADHPQDWQDSYEMVLLFLKFCQFREEIIPHGETFGRSEDERIKVFHHQPSEQYPAGWVELVLDDAVPHADAPGSVEQPTPEQLEKIEPDQPDVAVKVSDIPTDPITVAPARSVARTVALGVFSVGLLLIGLSAASFVMGPETLDTALMALH